MDFFTFASQNARLEFKPSGYEWTPTPRKPWVVRAVDGRAISRHDTAEQAQEAFKRLSRRANG